MKNKKLKTAMNLRSVSFLIGFISILLYLYDVNYYLAIGLLFLLLAYFFHLKVDDEIKIMSDKIADEVQQRRDKLGDKTPEKNAKRKE